MWSGLGIRVDRRAVNFGGKIEAIGVCFRPPALSPAIETVKVKSFFDMVYIMY